MSTVTIARPKQIAPLSAQKQSSLRPFALLAVLSATVFSGIVIALQVAILAPYPGTGGDITMKVLSLITMMGIIATILKIGEVRLMGPSIERKLESGRSVKLSDMFNREIRSPAIWGGILQAVYVLLFVILATKLPPTALASSKACIVFAIVLVELIVGILPRGNKRLYMRLAASVVTTFLGAAVVVFANGFELGVSGTYLWLFLGLLIPGNIALALAEFAEWKGVHKANTAASVYTLARFSTYTLTCVTAMFAWGITHNGFGIFFATINMVIDRWYLMVPITLFWGITDLIRICVKTVVPATYMYVIMSLAVAIDAITQTVAKGISPKIYAYVPGGLHFTLICIVGGLIITIGAKLFPHPKKVKI